MMESESRRRLGRYYTPDKLAHVLVQWAVTDRTTTILDPSFGGCAFFHASARRLAQMGVRRPGRFLYGVDVDPSARQYLDSLGRFGTVSEHFRISDFLTIQPKEMVGAPFRVVLGNPPYIRHHRLADKFDIQRQLGLQASDDVSAMASCWAYFVLHSISFVAPGGRLALVLPGALLYADYAAGVRRKLISSFASVTFIVLRERIFDEAEESTVLLIADGRGRASEGARIGVVDSVDDVPSVLQDSRRETKSVQRGFDGDRWLSIIAPAKAINVLEGLRDSDKLSTLGDIASVRTGTVTGCNQLFIISEPKRRELRVPQVWTHPIVNRGSQLSALSFTEWDRKRLVAAGMPSLLLSIPVGKTLPIELRSYLDGARKEGIHRRYKCQIRSPWYRLPTPTVPQAFLHYMSGSLPRIVLNTSKASCTNAIHQLYWTNGTSSLYRRFLALASLSTLFQLSAAIEGRAYGGGVLKIEPGEATNLVLPKVCHLVKNIDALFRNVQRLLRIGDSVAAVRAADAGILQQGLNLTTSEIESLRDGERFLRELRLPNIHREVQSTSQ